MRATHREIQLLLAERGLISCRDHRHLTRPLQWLESQGKVVRLMSNVYGAQEIATKPWARIRAVNLWDPTAVVTGAAAARWTFWEECPVATVEVAVEGDRRPQKGFAFTRRSVPQGLRLHKFGVWVTVPSLTAIDLVPQVGGDGIDRALRTGATDLSSLWDALDSVPYRRGNALRRQLVVDSCDVPWSAAERLLHRLLRSSDLRGWRTNQTVVVDGQTFCADILFESQRVIIEVDGWEWHGRRPADFRRTLRRHTTLEAAGWRVLHLSQFDLESDPVWVMDRIRQALAW